MPLLRRSQCSVQACCPTAFSTFPSLAHGSIHRPDVSWWKKDYDDALQRDTRMKQLAEESPAMQRTVNVDVWFDRIAFQPAQATFGISAGGVTGRGLGLGFAEVIPVADSDYIYAAIGEELGLAGGAVVILALIVFVNAGVRTALESRDMFTKLCSAGVAPSRPTGVSTAAAHTGAAYESRFRRNPRRIQLINFCMLGL